MNRCPRFLLLAALAGAAATAVAARAAEPEAVQGDAAARALLDEVARAYRKLDAYADHGEAVTRVTVDGKSEAQTAPVRITFARPNKLSVQTRLARLACDGKTVTTAVVPFKKYETREAPRAVSFETFHGGPVGSVLFGSPLGRPLFAVVSLLVNDDPVPAVAAELGGRVTSQPDREVDGVKCRVVEIGQADGPSYLLLIDPDTKLLRGIDVRVEPKALAADFPDSARVALAEFGWRAGKVSTDAPDAGVFSPDPPKGFGKVEPYTAEGAQEEKKHRVEDMVGKPAPAFTLTLLDGEGKFRRVTKEDLAGKVVLIDFWATWCAPCLAELPEVQKLVESYGKDKKDVVVVALSEDQRPSELGEVRKLVEKTLGQKKIALTGTPVGQIALDPSGTIGEAFQVEAFPTVVILDAKGVIRAAHVGFSPDVRKILTRDIDALLKGENPKKAGD